MLEVELMPAQLLERTAEKVRAAALRRPFSSEGLLCQHGKIDSRYRKNLSFKRVSSVRRALLRCPKSSADHSFVRLQVAVDRLVQLGCDIDVHHLAISEATICFDCTRAHYTGASLVG